MRRESHKEKIDKLILPDKAAAPTKVNLDLKFSYLKLNLIWDFELKNSFDIVSFFEFKLKITL